jgi:hypothetical protein
MSREALHELIDRIPESEMLRRSERWNVLQAMRRSGQQCPRHQTMNRSLRETRKLSLTPGESFTPAWWFHTTRFSANSESDEVCVA